MKQSGGYIFVSSVAGEDTTFRVYLPAVAGAPGAQQPSTGGASPRGTETVLIVEDDNDVRVLTALMLTAAGYHTVMASSGEDALRLLGESHDPIDLVLIDVVVPGMTGAALPSTCSSVGRRPGCSHVRLYRHAAPDHRAGRAFHRQALHQCGAALQAPHGARQLNDALAC